MVKPSHPRRAFSVLCVVLGLIVSATGVQVAQAQAAYQLTVTRLTPTPQLSGDDIVYRIEFQCAAVDEAVCIDSSMSIPLPSAIQNATLGSHPYVEAWTWDGTSVEIDLTDTIPAGSTAALELTMNTFNGTTPDGFVWDVEATLSSANTEEVTASADGEVSAMADIRVVKNLNGSPITALDTNVRYFIRVCDPSDPGASGSLYLETGELVDTLPPGSVFVAASGAGTYDSGAHTVTWSDLTDFGAGQCLDTGGQFWIDLQFPSGTFSVGDDVTNTATVTGFAYGDPVTEYTDTDDVLHGFGPPEPNGIWSKAASTPYFGNIDDTFAGDIASGYEATWSIQFRNNGNVPVGFSFVDPIPCISNNHTSETPGSLCSDPAFVTEALATSHFRNPGLPAAVANGWAPEFTTTGGTTGSFVVTDAPAFPPLIRWGLPPLPPGEIVNEIRWPYDSGMILDNDGALNTLMAIYGHMVADEPAGAMPEGEVVTNTAFGTIWFNDEPGPELTESEAIGIRAPVLMGSISKQRQGDHFLSWFGNIGPLPVDDMMFTDLLPEGFGVTSVAVSNADDGTMDPSTYDLDVIDDYLGSGRTLVRVTFRVPAGPLVRHEVRIFTDPDTGVPSFPFGETRNEVQLHFGDDEIDQCQRADDTVRWGSSGSLSSSLTTEPIDYDGDGSTVDSFCQAFQTTRRTDTFALLNSEKRVMGDQDATFEGFPTVGSSSSGGSGSFEVEFENQGSMALDNFVVYDVFPDLGDVGVSDTQLGSPRLTEFRPTLATPIAGLPVGFVVEYSTAAVPCRPEVAPSLTVPTCTSDWTATPPATLADATAIRVTSPSGFSLAPGDAFTFSYDVDVPISAVPGDVAWNSFAVVADRTDTGDTLLATEPPKVGLAVPLTDLSIDKQIEGGDAPVTRAVGDDVEFRIEVAHDTVVQTNPDGSTSYVDRNDPTIPGQPSTARGVELTDVLPTGMTIVPGSSSTACNGLDGGDFDETTGVWTIGDIAPGEAFVLCYRATVSGTGTFDNVAEITFNGVPDADSEEGSGDDGEDDRDTARLIVVEPAIELEKRVESEPSSGVFIDADDDDGDADAGRHGSGDAITYQFVVTNTTPVALSDVVVSDPMIDFFCGPLTLATLAGNASETLSCTWPLGWGAGLTTNTATVTASSPTGDPVGDSDSADVEVLVPVVDLEKSTDGIDADDPADAVPVAIGDEVTWTYVITNTGTDALVDLVLSDDREASVAFQEPECTRSDGLTGTAFTDPVEPNDSVTCSFSGTATSGLYANTGTVTASGAFSGDPAESSDPSHYLAPEPQPAIDVEKATNGADADDPADGPQLATGAPLEWTYVITNSGNAPLSDIVLVDDRETTVSLTEPECERSDGLTGAAFADPLGQGDTITCTFSGVAADGAYANTATVTGSDGTITVDDEDPSHHSGISPSVDVEKATNGVDADIPADGVVLATGEAVTWTYVITNTSLEALTDLALVDDVEADVSLDATACERSDAAPLDAPLPPGERIACEFTAAAVSGEYANTATATGIGEHSGQEVTDDDPSHYVASSSPPSVDIEKATNGLDADSPDEAPSIAYGDPVVWTYVITNSGEAPLTDLTLVDDVEADVSLDPDRCERGDGLDELDAPLESGDTITCTFEGTAHVGDYTNTATVTAMGPGDPGPGGEPTTITVDDADPSHYTGEGEADVVADKGVHSRTGIDLVWELGATNIGTGPAVAPIVVEDDLPPDMTLVSIDAVGWNCSTEGRVVRCEWPRDVEPGERIFLRLEVDLESVDAAVSNDAIVMVAGREVLLDNNSATATSSANQAAPPTSGQSTPGPVPDAPPATPSPSTPPANIPSALAITGSAALAAGRVGLLLVLGGLLLVMVGTPGSLALGVQLVRTAPSSVAAERRAAHRSERRR